MERSQKTFKKLRLLSNKNFYSNFLLGKVTGKAKIMHYFKARGFHGLLISQFFRTIFEFRGSAKILHFAAFQFHSLTKFATFSFHVKLNILNISIELNLLCA